MFSKTGGLKGSMGFSSSLQESRNMSVGINQVETSLERIDTILFENLLNTFTIECVITDIVPQINNKIGKNKIISTFLLFIIDKFNFID
jgi:hypothetical protein